MAEGEQCQAKAGMTKASNYYSQYNWQLETTAEEACLIMPMLSC